MFDQTEIGSSIAAVLIRILVKHKKGIKVVHINAQSLIKKIDEFKYLFVQSNVDDTCTSETWFLPDFSDLSVACNDHVVYVQIVLVMLLGSLLCEQKIKFYP